ncbi:hypothetical protein [Pantoea agglomerans]|uniref:hypothetical protein n=1 Tax=Enterobacter agglomerans TaxID=549 RepID=UPI0014412763|nr:hypothetical protein [Pantoea agglomerans]
MKKASRIIRLAFFCLRLRKNLPASNNCSEKIKEFIRDVKRVVKSAGHVNRNEPPDPKYPLWCNFRAGCTSRAHKFCEVNHLFNCSAIPQKIPRQYGRKFFCAVLNAFLFFARLAYFLH